MAISKGLIIAAAVVGVGFGGTMATASAGTDTASPLFDGSKNLFGDWGGVRKSLYDSGLDLQLSYVNELAHNVEGGSSRKTVYADQFYLGGAVDFNQLFGLHGSQLKFTMTNRNGQNLSAEANLNTLMLVNEVWGQGNYTRLNQFYWEQQLFGNALDLKIGRLSGSFEFMPFSCEFQNLTFCGTIPAYMTPNWTPFPGSTWAAVARYNFSAEWYLQGGLYEVNPNYQKPSYTFAFGSPFNGRGARALLETGWQPRIGGLPGAYRFGIWYDNVGGSDVFLDGNSQPQTLTGGTSLQRGSQSGFYAMAQQKVWAAAGSGTRGLTLFLNFVQADADIAAKDQIAEVGLFWTGPLGFRPQDDVGFAIGRVHVNSRIADGESLYNAQIPPGSGVVPLAVQNAEYPVELYYSVNVTPAVTLRPNVQWIHAPGGVDDRNDVVVLGLKSVINF